MESGCTSIASLPDIMNLVGIYRDAEDQRERAKNVKMVKISAITVI